MVVTSQVRLPGMASQSLHPGSPKALVLHQEQAGEERPSLAQPWGLPSKTFPDGSFQLVGSDKNNHHQNPVSDTRSLLMALRV